MFSFCRGFSFVSISEIRTSNCSYTKTLETKENNGV
uniref:Uncharacterized protein n=1 Tax=Arundo donax TaxID=35708 RepID=A0A0A9EHV5_ARUDO